MHRSLIDFCGSGIEYEVGNADVLQQMQTAPAKAPFDDMIVGFLNQVSKMLLAKKEAKAYPDVMTFAFWIRKASVESLKKRFFKDSDYIIRIGRGLVFHIAPSNVPVNYAYSLVSGLLCGNRNIVRIPSKDFEQVRIINDAIKFVLEENAKLKPYICLVKYGHDVEVNNALSSMADVRVVWGGDRTIRELRKSPLKMRATEITFADRYSLAVINSNQYMEIENKEKIANDFYNDTYLTDQNACTSPRALVWMGSRIGEAKKEFWGKLHELVEKKYDISGIQSVNKLTSGYVLAAVKDGVKRISSGDNLIVRMSVPRLTSDLMDLKDNSGYFFEYDCMDITEIKDICNDLRCQTISYIGNNETLKSLVMEGVAGVDRIVPVGKTMDFNLVWDGYNLFEYMTRIINVI